MEYLLPRLLVCGASLATLYVTEPLWLARTGPPLLPILPVPSINFYIPLLIASMIPIIAPRLGVGVYCGLLLWAVLADRTRVQPQFLTYAILYCAGISPTGRLVARVYLITFWFYAGIHKMLSPDFMEHPDLLFALIPDAPGWMVFVFPYATVLAEAGLALALLIVSLRKLAAVHICVFHLSIFVSLSPLVYNWNSSVWAWNLLLSTSGFWLFYNWERTLFADLFRARRFTRWACLFLLLYPIGFYFGLTDPYLSHNLYAQNIPTAYHCNARDECGHMGSMSKLNVPLPPTHGVFRDYFRYICRPADYLKITDARRPLSTERPRESRIECPVLP